VGVFYFAHMNYETILEEMKSLAIVAGSYIRTERKTFTAEQIFEKGLHDYVTKVDKASEKMIVSELSKLIPEAGFHAEEGTSVKKGEIYNWIIDPLDGTTNYIHGIPCYAVSIALTKNNIPVAGVVYEINYNECFSATIDSPAYLNDKEIKVSANKSLQSSLLATGFPYHDYGKIDEYLALFKHLMKHSRGLRRLGSAATDLAYVACGRFDGFYEYGLNPWDVAAGVLIVKQAGGKVSDFSGTDNFVFGKQLLADNGHIHASLLESVKKYF
jgi:myo-inositol-1(or 4)-monophosphatase